MNDKKRINHNKTNQGLFEPQHACNADRRSVIEEAIYKKRLQLNECADIYGLADPRCLRKSIELDQLINQFNRLKKAAGRDHS